MDARLVRKLTPEDFDAVVDVLNSHAHEKYFAAYGLNYSKDQVQKSIENIALGVFEGERLAAFVLFRALGPSLFELDLMVTHKDMLHKNYMESLFLKMEDWVPAANEIWLEVHQDNIRAQNFYEKHGFFIVGTRAKYYADGGSATLMSRKPHIKT